MDARLPRPLASRPMQVVPSDVPDRRSTTTAHPKRNCPGAPHGQMTGTTLGTPATASQDPDQRQASAQTSNVRSSGKTTGTPLIEKSAELQPRGDAT